MLLFFQGVLPSCNIDGYKVTVRNLRSGEFSVLWLNILDSNTSLVLDGEMYRISIAVYKSDSTSPEVFITVPAVGEGTVCLVAAVVLLYPTFYYVVTTLF